MKRENVIFNAVVLCLFMVAVTILVYETRSIWAAEKLIHEGNLTSYSKLEEFHVFTFEDNTTSMEPGWLWKRYPRLNIYVRLYRRDGALVLEEVTEPSIGS